MDRITAQYLSDFSKEHGVAHLDEAKRFEHFACFVVTKQHHNIAFDTDDLVTGDGGPKKRTPHPGGDTGIDGIIILVNGSLITDVDMLSTYAAESTSLDVKFIFVQAERSENFSAAKIGTFGAGVLDFFSPDPRLRRNQRIVEAAEIQSAIYDMSSKFEKGNPSCKLYYVTNGKWVEDDTLRARMDMVKQDLLSTHLFSEVDVIPIDAEKLQSYYRGTKNAITKRFSFPQKLPVGDIDGIKDAYIGFLPAPDFVSLISRESGEMLPGLFDSNVRDWYGYNTVNKEIQETLKSVISDRFVLMNNGITVIAKKIIPSGHWLTITDFQVVNGCQTSHVLFDNRTLLNSKIMVPIRVIGTDDEKIVNSIVRATNRQTEVREDQFFALQEFPKQLEHFFQSFGDDEKKLFYERRMCQYDRLPVEKTRVITEASVVRSFASVFLDEAHRTTRNYRALREKIGNSIFCRGHKLEPYYVSAFAFYRLESLFRLRRLEAKYKPARYHILMCVRMLAAYQALPLMNSNAMVSYCESILRILWSQSEAEDLIMKAVSIVSIAAAGDYQRDNIRTEPFTKKVKETVLKVLAGKR